MRLNLKLAALPLVMGAMLAACGASGDVAGACQNMERCGESPPVPSSCPAESGSCQDLLTESQCETAGNKEYTTLNTTPACAAAAKAFDIFMQCVSAEVCGDDTFDKETPSLFDGDCITESDALVNAANIGGQVCQDAITPPTGLPLD